MSKTMTRTATTAKTAKPTAYDRLHEAAAAGREALDLFIAAEQKKRDDKARQEWQGYRLVRHDGDMFWSEIETPEGHRYRCIITEECVKRFVGDQCIDQKFCDAVNVEARRLKADRRLETKHAEIAHIRERETPEGRKASRDRQPTQKPNTYAVSTGKARTLGGQPNRALAGMVGAAEQGGR